MKLLEILLNSIIFFFINIYIMDKVFNMSLKNKKCFLLWNAILFSILMTINFLVVPKGISAVTNTFILIFLLKQLFPNEKINSIAFYAITCQLITLISEMTFVLIITIIFTINQNILIENVFGTLITNVLIATITIVLVQFKFIKKICSTIVEKIKNFSDRKSIIIFVILIAIINLLLLAVYYKLDLISLIIINIGFIIFIAYIAYKLLDEKNKLLIQTNRTLQYKAENEALITNLHEYEKLADQHRLLNHENKNQLIAIKQMIENNEDRVVPYINNILKTKIPDDQSLLSKTKRIPSGGLQGIIYQKLLSVKKKKIKYSLNISRELKTLDFKKLDIDSNVELCKIVGVFLDNAIDEVKKLKNRGIGVELYVEDDSLCISISNTYGRNTDISRIGEEGYSTKGEGHGYGLSLVRKIVENNSRFENTKSVIGKYFMQTIKVSGMKYDD